MIGFPLAVTFKLSVKKHLFYFIFLFIPLCLSADESFYYFWKLYQNASTFLEKENYLVQAIESWKITDGEENKEIAREHLDFIRYNEGVSLFNNKSYNDALVLFLKISDSYYPYQTKKGIRK
jgi:hypothetical protein